MGTVYSTRFIKANVAGAGPTHTTYTVPVGKVAVVRSVDLRLDNANSHVLFGDTSGVYWLNVIAPTLLTLVSWRGRHVYTAGEVLDVYVFVGPGQGIVSGYLLDAV